MAKPLTTIVVLCWNQEEFVEDCLESVSCADGAANRRVIVIDNGSTDDSAARIRSFMRGRMPNWELMLNSRNLGIPRALNLALQATDTEFFSAIAADDFVDPLRYSTQEEVLLEFESDVVMVSGRIIRTSADGTPFPDDLRAKPSPTPGLYTFREAIFSQDGKRHYAGFRWACNQVWRRRALSEVGGYDTRFLNEDVPLEIRAAVLLNSRFESVAEAIVYYRQHAGSAMTTLWAFEWARMWETFLAEIPFTELERAYAQRSWGDWRVRAAYEEALLAIGRREQRGRLRLLRQTTQRSLAYRSRVSALRLALDPRGPEIARARYRRAPRPTDFDSEV